jgi:hypothetical protein
MRFTRITATLAFAAALAIGVASCKDAMAPSVLANMGGMEGVSKFLDNWKGTMSANESLSKALTAEDMNMVARGFTNEIAKASEIPLPNAGVDLPQVLKDKNLSKENLTAMRDALKTAAGTSALSPDATKGALSLWDGAAAKAK